MKLLLPLLLFWAALRPAAVGAACRPSPLSVGMTVNLYVTDDPMDQDVPGRRHDQVKAAGADFTFYSPRWSDLETSPGAYQDAVFDLNVARAADRGLSLLVNFKVVDTYVRCLPVDLSSLAFDDPAVLARFKALLNHFLPRLKGNARWISLGNEVDLYLAGHLPEGPGYLSLYEAGAARVRALAPAAHVSMTITSGALFYDETRPLRDAGDFLCLTYYGIDAPAYTSVKVSSAVKADFTNIASNAEGKRILFQELGYPSGVPNGSDPGKQAQFYQDAFDAMEGRDDVFLGGNFMLLADLSFTAAQTQALAYSRSDAAFISYLQTLGVVNDLGAVKPAWDVFSLRATALRASDGEGCKEEEIVCYPTPWDARRHGGQPVRFDHLPDEGTLRILTLSGELTAEVPIVSGRASWDLKDRDGRTAASGVYLAVEKGGKSRGKFAVVR